MYRSLLLLVILMFLAPAPFQPVRAACNPDAFLRRVSVSSSGEEANNNSFAPIISGNGRVVAFISAASNLVPNDTNNAWDAFIHNLDTCETIRVSESATGEQSTGTGERIALSWDGRIVVFNSTASNLVPNDTNGLEDIFVRDMLTGDLQQISVGPGSVEANGRSLVAQVSADGNLIVHESTATNLQSLIPVSGNPPSGQIYVYNRQTGQHRLISVNALGQVGNNNSSFPDISADGRVIVFDSQATNLLPGDINPDGDIYRVDMQTGEMTLASVGQGLGDPGIPAQFPKVSGDGRYIIFLFDGQYRLRDHQNQTTITISINENGEMGNFIDMFAGISANARFVSLDTGATNLLPDDTRPTGTILAYELATKRFRRIVLTAQGEWIGDGSSHSGWSAISANGDAFVFITPVNGLIPEDTNGFADVYVTGLPPASPIIPQRNFYTVQNPVLTWAGTSNTIRYELQVARTAMFTPPLAFQTTVNAPQQEAEVTLVAGQYFWRVRSCTGPTTCGAWSAVDSFVIELP